MTSTRRMHRTSPAHIIALINSTMGACMHEGDHGRRYNLFMRVLFPILMVAFLTIAYWRGNAARLLQCVPPQAHDLSWYFGGLYAMLIFPQLTFVMLTLALLTVTALSYVRRTLVTDLACALVLIAIPCMDFLSIARTSCK